MCLHNHQPVGNFDHVFEWGFRDCYGKILDVLKHYPEFRFAVHHSGPLLEWLQTHEPKYMETLNAMVQRKQVEIIGGGFYEPIFSIISEPDIKGQIAMMQDYCRERFGVVPSGFWTAERVWDPEIPRLVTGFGLEYTLLDDNHFRYAGIEESALYGYYMTERLHYPLKVFPIDKFLRYSIPFKLPEETITYFRVQMEKSGDRAFIYGDDGEKFGMWPGTHKWVFEEHWLVNFVEAVLKEGWIKMTLPSEYIRMQPPVGRVYLTQGSYYELSEWALPPPMARRIISIHREIKNQGRENDFYPFLKGGVWNNFLNKYPESNAMNKRSLLLSRELEELRRNTGRDHTDIAREIYRGECNCAYWHGLFGGIYLSSLRHALHEHLLCAEGRLMKEQKLKTPDLREEDFWNEGEKQYLIRTKKMSAVVVPAHGGCLSELGIYDEGFDILNVMPRRYEAYHDDLLAYNENEENNGEVKSIHDMVTVKEKGLKNYLVYDKSRRYSFKELFFNALPDVESLMFGRVEYVDCGGINYSGGCELSNNEVSIKLTRDVDYSGQSIRLIKRLVIGNDETAVAASYSVSGAKGLLIGIEFNINLLGGHDENRFYDIPGCEGDGRYLDSLGAHKELVSCSLVDRVSGITIILAFSKKVELLRYPVFTVSQSDRGYEKNYQGSCVIAAISLPSDNEEFSISMTVYHGR